MGVLTVATQAKMKKSQMAKAGVVIGNMQGSLFFFDPSL